MYLGPASDADIAKQIKQSCGPSGPNEEYARNLAAALREYSIDDAHVFSIETALDRL